MDRVTLAIMTLFQISAAGALSAQYSFSLGSLDHDFPVRIIYARDGEAGLAPRIEGRDGEQRGWTLRRTSCPG